jgi:spermidine/putrescine transport system substrate-binding protein
MTNMENTITRRSLLKVAAATAGAAALGGTAPRAFAQSEEITIMTWETYHDDDWLAEWTAKSGVKVNAIRIGSNDETYAKLRSGAAEVDAFVLDIGSMQRFIEAKLMAPFDVSKVPNASNIASGLDWQKETTFDGQPRAVPYNWGTQPLMYNTETVKPAPMSWKIFWDPNHAGKVVMPDDAYIVFPMVALAIGAKDPYNLTEEEFEKCMQAFRDLRPQLRTLARGFDDATTIFASGDADVGYCQNISSVFALKDQGKPFDFSFPDEGTPTWIDCYALSESGAKRQVVYDFINETMTPQWQARFIQKSSNNGILDAAAATAAGLPEDSLNKTNIPALQDPKFWERMSFFKHPENVDRRLEIWNAFKAGTL